MPASKQQEPTVGEQRQEQQEAEPSKASFIAVGDNLVNDSILQLADGWSGEAAQQEDGLDSSNSTLVVYGLGDFVSGYANASDCVLSGAFTCDFEKDVDGKASVTNPRWIPLVEHRSGNEDYVVPVRDYPEEDAQATSFSPTKRTHVASYPARPKP